MAPAPSPPWVTAEMSGSVLWLTLNRPGQRNPLSSQMIDLLQESLAAAEADTDVRCIVIAGSGPAFSAGHDLREMAPQAGETDVACKARMRGILEACSRLMLGITQSPKAVVACVQGIATAAGCQLVAACDLAIASEEARFCLPGVNIGAFCTTPLVAVGRNIHRKHAMELALTGDLFDAGDAVRMGLVNRAVAADRLHSVTEQLAQKIASKSTEGIARGKSAFYEQLNQPLAEAYGTTCEPMIETMTTADAREGTQAFFGKRQPVWPQG
ncbi:enoyl-CoA hydratase [Haliea sp. E1-2-M8]|uniref:enoyl-CoA hydratase n=1 Tax=Haliea sp. E1-2-M8 TaxID=3064706 RepID=UPI002719CB0E|nr:enoyl-CoA hydratase [Haliea sp. E1-2-M8]MDO8861047.1 enoyl-CoA hydratase [Haliea sp. E1-2-M8]